MWSLCADFLPGELRFKILLPRWVINITSWFILWIMNNTYHTIVFTYLFEDLCELLVGKDRAYLFDIISPAQNPTRSWCIINIILNKCWNI